MIFRKRELILEVRIEVFGRLCLSLARVVEKVSDEADQIHNHENVCSDGDYAAQSRLVVVATVVVNCNGLAIHIN